jgi:hypothetical protein
MPPGAARIVGSATISEAYFCLVEPITEFGMHDYRLDEVEKPERHADAVERLTESSHASSPPLNSRQRHAPFHGNDVALHRRAYPPRWSR